MEFINPSFITTDEMYQLPDFVEDELKITMPNISSEADRVKFIDMPTEVTEQNFAVVRCFINPNENFTIESLQECLNWIAFVCSDNFSILNHIIRLDNTGLQTSTKRKTFNSRIIYRLLRLNHINAVRDLNLKDAVYLLNMIGSSRTSMISYLEGYLSSLSDDKLLDLLSETHFSAENGYSHTQENIEKISNTRILINELSYPSTHHEAIILSARQFCRDVSKSRYPLVEYHNLKKHGVLTSYRYVDYELMSIPDLRKKFNINLPRNCYEITTIARHMFIEGFKNYGNQDIQELYNDLSIYYIYNNTFFDLEDNKYISDKTHLLILDVKEHDIIGYGKLDELLQPISIRELKDLFLTNMSFVCPFSPYRNYLTQMSIEKLKHICQDRNTQESSQLKRVILDIEAIHKEKSSKIQEYIERYKGLQEDKKLEYDDFWNTFYKMTLKMRGWDGITSELPIARSVLPGSQEEIDKLVYDEMMKLIYHPVAETHLDLPIILYQNKAILYGDESNGSTIRGRINIIIFPSNRGDALDCIRVSSNIFLYTYYYYQQAIEKIEDVNFDDIATLA